MKKKIVIIIILFAVLLSSYYVYRGIYGKEALWEFKEVINKTFDKRERVVGKIPADADSGVKKSLPAEKSGEKGQEKPAPAALSSDDREEARTEDGEKAGSKEYYIQVASWRNHAFAREKLKEMKKSYPDAYIAEDNEFRKIRIPNIINKEEGTHVIAQIKEEFNLVPLLVSKTETEQPLDEFEEEKEGLMPEYGLDEPVRKQKIVKSEVPSQDGGDKKGVISVLKDWEAPAEKAVSVPSETPPSEIATIDTALPLSAESPSAEIKEKEVALPEETIEEPIEKKEEALAEEPSVMTEETGEGLPLEEAIAGPAETEETAAREQLSEKTVGKVVIPPDGVIVPPVDAPLPIIAESPSFGIKEKKEAAPSEQTIEEPIEKKEAVLAEESSGIAEETEEVLPLEQATAVPGETGETAARKKLSIKTEGKAVVTPNGVTVPPVDVPLPLIAKLPSPEIKVEEAAPSGQTIEEPLKKEEEAPAEEPSGIAEETGEALPPEKAEAGPGGTGEVAAGEKLTKKSEVKVVVPPNGVIVPPADTPLPIFAEPLSSGDETGESLAVKEKILDVSKMTGIAERAAPHEEVRSEEEVQPLEKEIVSPVVKKESIQTEGTPPGTEKGGDFAFPGAVSIAPVTPSVTPLPVLPLLPTVELSEEQKDVITEGDEGRRKPEEQRIATAEKELSEERVQQEETLPGGEMTEEAVRRRRALQKEMSPQEYNRRVVIFPFENLSDDKDVMKHILPILIERIEKKGISVVDEDSLNNFLCKKRIRDRGYISGDLASTIKEEFYASKILTGSIISFSDEENPRFGILARLIDASEGTILWADYGVATGEDFITILNLGRLNTVFSVIPRVMDMLFASFAIEALPGEAKTSYRIGVMPFKNNSSFKNAGIVAMHMFVIELLKSPEFMPIEYGNVRDEIIRLRIWSKGELNYQNINTLSHELDARGILVGVVDDYAKGDALSSPPLVGITVRLINGRNNKILWYNSDQSNGDENLIALDWGRMRSVHTVAYEVVSNLVGRMGTVKWQ